MPQPNILLVFCDQLRYDAIAAHGNPVIQTPVLDQLVSEGVTFDAAYTPCPVCVPARFSMHTGQAPHRTGVFENTQLPEGRRSFMEMLRDAGYQTYGAGKMHFTFPSGLATTWGFDERATCESKDGSENDFQRFLEANGFGHVQDPKGVRSEMYYIPQVSQLPPHLHHTAWTVDSCIDFLGRRDGDKPFFVMTSFEKPHPPFEPPVPWNKLYRGPDMPLPKIPEDSDSLMTLWNKFQNRYKYRDQGTDRNLIRQMKAHYYAEISYIDHCLGRLFQAMRDEGVYEETLIVFTADHGELLGDYGCYGKRCFLDAAARIPLIVRFPGIEPGRRSADPVSLVDLLPTFLDVAGIEPEEDYSGGSLLRILDGSLAREETFGQYERGEFAAYMIRTEQYKYVYSAPDETEYLFDVIHDPEETRNRASNPLFTGVVRELRERLMDHLSSDGYTDPIEDGKWKRWGVKTMPKDPDAYLLFQDPAASLPSFPGYETDANSKRHFAFHWYEDRYDSV
ncbi:MAG TPA: sulfatase-like hydrolase/transferase [Spirochaetia bacterium]|nr:sulfatase-like hydrolase/transferase [Spirochaetia bacterium]